MKMPHTVTELAVKETIQAVKNIAPTTPPISSPIQSTQIPMGKAGINPKQVLIGLLAIGVLAFVVYKIYKKHEENKLSN